MKIIPILLFVLASSNTILRAQEITGIRTVEGFASTDPLRYNSFLREPSFDTMDGVIKISKQEAMEDLDELARLIQDRHSYIYTVDFKYRKAIDHLKASFRDSVAVPGLALQIQKMLQYIGDSHSYVQDWMELLPKKYTPVHYGIENNRLFVYRPDKLEILEDGFPYVRSLDGIPIDRWFERAGDIASGIGSSESSRFNRGRLLMPYIAFMRSELGIKPSDSLTYILESADGLKVKEITLPVVPCTNFDKPFGLPEASGMVDKDIGYLRIYSQKDERLLQSIDSLMASFKETKALIIDARQCGGGKRSILQKLFPYFMKTGDGPYIANVARLRIPDGIKDFDPRGKLDVGDKKLKFINDDDVGLEESKSLGFFLKSFTPSVILPEKKFTDYYFMALTAKPDTYFYDKPVYLIMDFGVGSAGDIFVSVFKDWRNVTLVGTPSNGRSGNSILIPLSNSRIPVRLSTMVSYQKSGELYDWVGIFPDIYLEPTLSDWLKQSDSVLEKVIELINAP